MVIVVWWDEISMEWNHQKLDDPTADLLENDCEYDFFDVRPDGFGRAVSICNLFSSSTSEIS